MDHFIAPLGFNWDSGVFPKIESKADLDRQIECVCFRAKKIFPELVYNTTALEDNPFTFPEVQTLLEGITVGGHRLEDERQVLNQASSWRFLIQKVSRKEFTVTMEMFCTLHGLVAKEEILSWGVFRDGEVRIGGTDHAPPRASELDGIFGGGIEVIEGLENTFEKAILAFLFGALNQFFWDGNKRTSRLFMNGILMSAGHDAINIPARARLEFNTKMIRFYDTKCGTEMAEFLLLLSGFRPS